MWKDKYLSKIKQFYTVTGIPLSIFDENNQYIPICPEEILSTNFEPYILFFSQQISDRKLPLQAPWIRLVLDSIFLCFVRLDDTTVLQLGPIAADKMLYKKNIPLMKQYFTDDLVSYFIKQMQMAPKISLQHFIDSVGLCVNLLCNTSLQMEDYSIDMNMPTIELKEEPASSIATSINESHFLSNPIFDLIETGNYAEFVKLEPQEVFPTFTEIFSSNPDLWEITLVTLGAIASHRAILGGVQERSVQSLFNSYLRKSLLTGVSSLPVSYFFEFATELTRLVNQAKGGSFQSDIIRKATIYIRENLYSKITMEALEKEAGATRRTLLRHFNDYLNTTPSEYIKNLKLAEVKQLLLNTDIRIIDISAMLGYSSQSYLNSLFTKKFGCTLREFRQRGNAI